MQLTNAQRQLIKLIPKDISEHDLKKARTLLGKFFNKNQNSSPPKTLYKYRDRNNSYHRRMLSNNELFFANNKKFNQVELNINLIIVQFLANYWKNQHLLHRSQITTKILQ